MTVGSWPTATIRRTSSDASAATMATWRTRRRLRFSAALDRSRLHTVVAAHLSRQNNRADLARLALAAVLECAPDLIPVADQDHGSGWLQA